MNRIEQLTPVEQGTLLVQLTQAYTGLLAERSVAKEVEAIQRVIIALADLLVPPVSITIPDGPVYGVYAKTLADGGLEVHAVWADSCSTYRREQIMKVLAEQAPLAGETP